MVGGQIHYGWARLSIRNSRCNATALLTGYAYETVAGQAIATGKTSGPDGIMPGGQLLPKTAPPMLGLLAQGAQPSRFGGGRTRCWWPRLYERFCTLTCGGMRSKIAEVAEVRAFS